jgi:type IX secretion system PorP/SprF family membrane protein
MTIKFKHIKILMLLAVMLFAYQKSIAQTEPMYSQYMFNMMGVNPAYAGSREASGFNFFQRSQWIGLQGAPQTTSFSFDQSILNKKAGWGIQFYDDKIGVEKADGINIMGSTRIQVSENGILSGGLSLGLMNYRIDLMNVTGRFTPNDPAFYSNLNKWTPSLGLGIYYNTDNFYAGVSIPNILKSRLTAFDLIRSGLQKVNQKHIFLTTGIVIPINEDLKLKPSTMIKMVEGAPIEADLNTNVWLRDIIGLGISYRTGDAVIGMAEIQANQNLRFGYAYDMTISALKFYNTGTHEIMIRYEIGNFKTKIKSTRYF